MDISKAMGVIFENAYTEMYVEVKRKEEIYGSSRSGSFLWITLQLPVVKIIHLSVFCEQPGW